MQNIYENKLIPLSMPFYDAFFYTSLSDEHKIC